MKYVIYCLTFFSINFYSQTKYITKTGTVNFEASVPSFEEVKASNNSVTGIINAETGEFAALVLVNGFRFKNALMEEHFNENYAESYKFPKAVFKGKIKHSGKNHQIDGALTFHGKSKQIKDVPINYSTKNSEIEISGNFKVNTSDFDIKIPKIVQNKVSESVSVTFAFNLKIK